jgi:hypothetical protein
MTGPGRGKVKNRGAESFRKSKHISNVMIFKPRVLFLRESQMSRKKRIR